MTEKQYNDPIKEAERYIKNARQILKERAGLDHTINRYKDPKFVLMAGNTIWNGVLLAVDGVLGVEKGLKKGQRADFDDYKKSIDKRDKKAGVMFLDTYEASHKYMGYDGYLQVTTSKTALKCAVYIIEWCKKIQSKDLKK